MQYVNDDMDELFKRAAENYPLDTNSADWNKVLSALQNETGTKTISEKKTNKNGRFLWLLLLLPLGFICNRFHPSASSGDAAIFKKAEVEDGLSAKEMKKETGSSNYQTKSNANEDLSSFRQNINLIDQKAAKAGVTRGTIKFYGLSVQSKKHSYKLRENTTANSTTTNNDDVLPNSQRDRLEMNEKLKNDEPLYSRYVYEVAFPKKTLDACTTSVKRDMNPLFAPHQPKENIQVSRRKKFYAGLMGGVDVTTIKLQKIEDAGYGFGMLLGYQFNKRWSVEAGAFLERKYYYSDGKYINTSKIYLPANTWIDDASGDCKMVEVPLAVKYNFSTHKNSNLFATVGLSSYFMKEENYTYNYYYGTWGPVPHQKKYKNSSTDVFSAMSISAGYSHRLGNFADVRIEPYLKLPVYGMGIAELPFLSTGLQIGLTRKF